MMKHTLEEKTDFPILMTCTWTQKIEKIALTS